MTQETDSMCACTTCAVKWSEEIARCDRDITHKEYEKHYTTDLREYNGGYIYNGVFAIKGMIDTNVNHTDKCRVCMSPLGDDRLVGGNNFRYHNRCFYSRYGYID